MSTFFHNSTSCWDKTLEKVSLKKKIAPFLKKIINYSRSEIDIWISDI